MRIRIALTAAFAATAILVLCATSLSGAAAPTAHRHRARSDHRAGATGGVPTTTVLADLLSASTAPPPAPPAPPPAPPPPPAVSDATSTDTPDWQCIRVHESGDVYNDPARPSGAYGIELVTWQSNGYSGWPYQAPPAVQDALALKLYHEYGWLPWSTRFACGLGG